MNQSIRLILAPDVNQTQMLLDTIYRYNELLSYISQIVHNRLHHKPINLYYWEVDVKYDNFYAEVRDKFPEINSNLIPIAFRKVGKFYKKNKPDEAHEFGTTTIDCSKYLITIKLILPEPNNIGMLSISTLAGRQHMHFTFDGGQRGALQMIFSSKRYREYTLV